MANWIHGQTVLLHVKTASGLDDFGATVYADDTVEVENVLVEPTADDAVVTDLQLYGKRSAFTLHIPKGDAHTWTDTLVEFNGKTYRTLGATMQFQTAMCPLAWDRKVKVELYE